ncbi:MAG: hypothetical protein ACK5VV_10705 [Lysobacteraceae bacterium]
MNRSTPSRLAALGVAIALVLPPAQAADAGASAARDSNDFTATYRTLVDRQADAIVPVRYVITLSAGGQEQRNEDRTQGVIVGADGLVLVPARAVSLDLTALARPGQGMPAGAEATSSGFRVRLPGSDEWREADLVTRDTELGLAWLRVRDARGLPYIRFEELAEPAPGRVFYTLLRTSDEWGAVPLVRPGMILGETRVPRSTLLVDGMPGLAFDAAGRPMGYVDIDLAAMTRSQGRGLGLDMADMVMHLLPARRGAAATRLAAPLPAVRRDDEATVDPSPDAESGD